MLCANRNAKSTEEKTIGEYAVEIDKVGLVESLLNHMNLNDEININSPINTNIKE